MQIDLHTHAMLKQYPAPITLDRSYLADVIDVVMDCSQTCTACADACLSEPDVNHLTRCIRDCLDCADICTATERVLSRHTGYDASLTESMLRTCMQACQACAASCGEHADEHEHCRTCAQTCRSCEQACGDMLDAIRRTRGEGPDSPQAAAPQG